MNTQELRLGNLVMSNGILENETKPYILTVESIHPKNVKFNEINWLMGNMIPVDKFHPIPLTEEWLLKFGFDIGYHKTETSTQKFYSKLWGTNGVEIVVEDYHYKGFEYQLERSKYKFLEYVHQLQNLFFALTSEELIIKNE